MIVKLLSEHHLEFLSLKGGCRGLSGSALVKMSNCWKSHALAQISSYVTVNPAKDKHQAPTNGLKLCVRAVIKSKA